MFSSISSPVWTTASGPPAAASGRRVQHDGAVGGAAHARVRDAQHVGHALAQELGRNRQLAPLGHAGPALGAAVLEHQHGGGVDRQVVVVDVLEQVGARLEHVRPAAVTEQLLARRGALDHGAARRQRAAQDDDAAVGRERIGAPADDLAVTLDAREVLAHREAARGHRPELEDVADLGHHRGHAAGCVEGLHEVLRRRA